MDSLTQKNLKTQMSMNRVNDSIVCPNPREGNKFLEPAFTEIDFASTSRCTYATSWRSGISAANRQSARPSIAGLTSAASAEQERTSTRKSEYCWITTTGGRPRRRS